MNANSITVRTKVSIELGIIAVLTIVFLLLFPRRNPWLNVGMAGFALLCIGATAGYTKKVVWAASPPQPGPDRFRRCMKVTLWVTVPAVMIFLVVGGILGYRNGGLPGLTERILNWKILAVFAAYIGWALMQQTLFQFYLLGRLLALFPKDQPFWPVLITGFGFSLVHLPDVWTSLVTAIGGVVWTFIYYRYRRLLPLALSHAALGTAFYYGICGHDLAQEWRAAVGAIGS
jgi:membrane protease YdiL (CAAX protease family)